MNLFSRLKRTAKHKQAHSTTLSHTHTGDPSQECEKAKGKKNRDYWQEKMNYHSILSTWKFCGRRTLLVSLFLFPLKVHIGSRRRAVAGGLAPPGLAPRRRAMRAGQILAMQLLFPTGCQARNLRRSSEKQYPECDCDCCSTVGRTPDEISDISAAWKCTMFFLTPS